MTQEEALNLQCKMIFMHDNAPSHATEKTGEHCNKIGFKNFHFMAYIVLVHQTWTTLKACMWIASWIERYATLGDSFRSKNCGTCGPPYIVISAKNITAAEIKNIAKAVDKNLTSVISKLGEHVNKCVWYIYLGFVYIGVLDVYTVQVIVFWWKLFTLTLIYLYIRLLHYASFRLL